MNQIMKVVRPFLEKPIAAELTVTNPEKNVTRNATKQMNNSFQKIFFAFIFVFVSAANAQNLNVCNAQQSELKLLNRSQLLEYVCQAKTSIHNAEKSLLNMQVDFLSKSNSKKINENDFSKIKALADAKEVCVSSATIAFLELSKYGIKDGTVDDLIDYCLK